MDNLVALSFASAEAVATIIVSLVAIKVLD